MSTIFPNYLESELFYRDEHFIKKSFFHWGSKKML